MNIDKLGENVSARRMTKPTAINQSGTREEKPGLARKDRVDTSDWSQLIAKNISELSSSSAVRTDKIRQFAAQINGPVNIPGNAISTIFSRMI